MKGWAIFGILSCMYVILLLLLLQSADSGTKVAFANRLIVGLTLSCVGGFIYQTRVHNLVGQFYIFRCNVWGYDCFLFLCIIYISTIHLQRGLDAVPGMALLSACLETVSRSYTILKSFDDLKLVELQSCDWKVISSTLTNTI